MVNLPEFWDMPASKFANLPPEATTVRIKPAMGLYFQPMDKDGNPCGAPFDDAYPCPPFWSTE